MFNAIIRLCLGLSIVSRFHVLKVALSTLGESHVVLMSPHARRGRDVGRTSAAGKAALEAITADSVYEATARILG